MVNNSSGGKGFSKEKELQLAQMVVTSFIGDQYYSSAEDNLALVQSLANSVSPEFLAACTVYSREKGSMKSMPVVLLAILRERDSNLYRSVFPRVVNNSRILREFVAIIRSGKLGSKNLNNGTRKLIQKWFDAKHPVSLWNDSIGNNPSLKDVIALAHVTPGSDPERQSVMSLICKGEKSENLPKVIKDYYNWLENQNLPLPKVPFQRLISNTLTSSQWTELVDVLTWNQLRLNLNTLERHGVFNDKNMVAKVANLLDNPAAVKSSKVFPYDIYTSIKNVSNNLLKNSLQKCLDYSVDNVPELPYNTFIAVDVSGSMGCAVNSLNVNTGLSCAEVAGLMSLSLFKKNPQLAYLTFDTQVKDYTSKLNSMDSLASNMEKVNFNGGGTDCSAPLKVIRESNLPVDLIIMFSDNESWADYQRGSRGSQAIWSQIKAKNPNAKFVMIDLANRPTSQLKPSPDVLPLAGFSNSLFEVVAEWLSSNSQPDSDFVNQILKHYKS